ncbi:MAG TPA: hypothetical protein DGG95_05100 [Cytophagales bacterium]|jgi:predicted MPP superfamily phosphohydrolase|nr:hypothetical protein [Cytophagales bacterium]
MNKIKVVHISDIHFEKNEPENQGLIINAFFKDISSKLDETNKDFNYCIISGDLVNKGNSEKVFNEFYDGFIKKLLKHIPLPNIFCTPGNHDLNRSIVEENYDEHKELLSREFTESAFNEYIKTKKNLILKKFSPYEKFCREKLNIPNFNLYGFSEILIPEISVYFLNCSLFSSGGFDKIEDKGVLKFETAGLNKWIQENDGRTKMLVMHHPLSYLTNFAQGELKSMLKSGIDILISGHLHEQDLEHNYVTEQHGLIRLASPQLFSHKNDLNGYGILTFEGQELKEIEYRQWSKRFRKFMAGQDFTGSEEGIRKFTSRRKDESDFVSKKLLENFEGAMKSYSQTPIWVERSLCLSPPNSSKKTEIKIDYIDLINKPENFQIIAAPQFGLTCYAHYLALKAWEIKKNHWLYLDCEGWNLSKSIADINDLLNRFQIVETNVSCLLLDNWRSSLKDSSKIFDKIKKKFSTAHIIIFSNFQDEIIIEGLDTMESHIGFKQLYLRELSRKGMRNIVQNFTNHFQIAGDEHRIVERLDLDLIDLNIHRTPLNCIQLLIAFLNDFEDRPINRSKVFAYVLKVIFDNPGNLFYGNTLDENNCSFILGNFCEYLLRKNKHSFSESEFLSISGSFGKENYNTTNIPDLLQVLKNNQILVNANGELRFRFTYWMYFFAASRMKISKKFSDFMFSQKHSLYYPEVIEFYTGTDGAREDVAKMLSEDLEALAAKVHSKIGLKEDINPFSEIKWALNETVVGMTQQQLEENVKKSKLPDEIKDVVADKNYNSVKPYTQTINNFFVEYDVRNLMELTRSASRALRNSEFISPKLKDDLAQKIFNAWKEIVRVLLLIAPVLAKNGFGGLGGARFELSEDFPKEYSACLKKIVTVMPFNILSWYKDDLFSDKLKLLFDKYLIECPDPIVRHIIALLICTARPDGWRESITQYISITGKNSFYLGDLYSILCNNYSTHFMQGHDQNDTLNLIKACWIKNKTGSPSPGKDTISKVPDSALPPKNSQAD